ncbi:MAG: hypothetical protein U9O94_01810 [Nanoarchaeota archaeon]|nr:hypothetical protein [Nanoarchaeota archaeon]
MSKSETKRKTISKKATEKKVAKKINYTKMLKSDDADDLRKVIRKCEDRELVRLAVSKLETVKATKQFESQKDAK